MDPRTILRILAFVPALFGLSFVHGESNADNPSIGGVEILVENVENGRMAATRTGDTGHFSVSGLPPGEYRLIIGMTPAKSGPDSAGSDSPEQTSGYDVRLSVYGGAMTAQWVPAASPKMRVGIVFAVPARASGTIAGSIRTAPPPAVQTRITWVAPLAFTN